MASLQIESPSHAKFSQRRRRRRRFVRSYLAWNHKLISIQKIHYLLFKWILANFTEDRLMKASKANDARIVSVHLFYCLRLNIQNSSETRGNMFMLQLFKRFKGYAWGQACITCLDRMLSRASKASSELLSNIPSNDKGTQRKGRNLDTPRALTDQVQLIQVLLQEYFVGSHCEIFHVGSTMLSQVCR